MRRFSVHKKEYNDKVTQQSVKSFVLLFLTVAGSALSACTSTSDAEKSKPVAVTLPFMRVDTSECYFIDDFLPTPDNLVTGKSSGYFLRYYTYKVAKYKDWDSAKLMLSFYSRDSRCWSLYDEHEVSSGVF